MFHILALVGVFLAAFSPVNLKAVLLNSVATQSRGTVSLGPSMNNNRTLLT